MQSIITEFSGGRKLNSFSINTKNTKIEFLKISIFRSQYLSVHRFLSFCNDVDIHKCLVMIGIVVTLNLTNSVDRNIKVLNISCFIKLFGL